MCWRAVQLCFEMLILMPAKNFAKMKPATAKSTKEVKAAKENKTFDFTAPPPVAKQASKAFNGVFTGGITAKQPFVPKADPLPVYVNPVKSVFSTVVPKKQVGARVVRFALPF